MRGGVKPPFVQITPRFLQARSLSRPLSSSLKAVAGRSARARGMLERRPAATASGSPSVPRTSTRSKPDNAASGSAPAVRGSRRARSPAVRPPVRGPVRGPRCAAPARGPCGPCRAATAVVDERRRRAPLALALQHERVGGERDHARADALGAVEHDRGGGHRRHPDGVAAHRAAVVHEQADRAPRRGPAAGDQLVGALRAPAGDLSVRSRSRSPSPPALPGLRRR